ncbi:hypothetical protein [Lysinibacillus xylanilyticus]|uniref:hypothetical protein n=1 Tax=Lysinibacillus xylanilyticus TaxID=582475 RepID=UPI003D0312E4
MLLAISFIFTLNVPDISISGHVGGFISGFVLGYIFQFLKRIKKKAPFTLAETKIIFIPNYNPFVI